MKVIFKHMKISIIVPIYNVDQYLEKCLTSIISQTFFDYEVLLINDGSTDFSRKICEKFVAKDNRFKLIDKKNGGLSDARNTGLELAEGDYVFFLDSDDLIPVNALEDLYYSIERYSVDISIGSYKRFYNNKKYEEGQITNNDILIINNEECILKFLKNSDFNHSAWGKLYKKNLFDNIKFPKDKLFEDIFTIYNVVLNSKSICIVNNDVYFYRIRENSILTSDENIIRKCNDLFESIQYLLELLINYENLKNALINFLVYQNINVLKFSTKIKLKEEKKIIKIRSKKFIMKYIKKFLLSRDIKIMTKVKVILYLIK